MGWGRRSTFHQDLKLGIRVAKFRELILFASCQVTVVSVVRCSMGKVKKSTKKFVKKHLSEAIEQRKAKKWQRKSQAARRDKEQAQHDACALARPPFLLLQLFCHLLRLSVRHRARDGCARLSVRRARAPCPRPRPRSLLTFSPLVHSALSPATPVTLIISQSPHFAECTV